MNFRELNKDGVGLGLTISKNLAQAFGGDISVESKVSKGSMFILSLPFDSKPMMRPQPFQIDDNPNGSLPSLRNNKNGRNFIVE
jgi:hypothetical protein